MRWVAVRARDWNLSMKVLKRAERGWRWVSVKEGREGSPFSGSGASWGSGEAGEEEAAVEGAAGCGSGCFGCSGCLGGGDVGVGGGGVGGEVNGAWFGVVVSGFGLGLFSPGPSCQGGGGCLGGGGAVENSRARATPGPAPMSTAATLQRKQTDRRRVRADEGETGFDLGAAAVVAN